VAASQSVVPQTQLDGLSAVPSVLAQVGNRLHRLLLDMSQKSPVADVQAPEAPQTQGAGLAVAPSPCGQAGAAKAHRQAIKGAQERVEDVRSLKYKLPPLVLLLLSKHPRG